MLLIILIFENWKMVIEKPLRQKPRLRHYEPNCKDIKI